MMLSEIKQRLKERTPAQSQWLRVESAMRVGATAQCRNEVIKLRQILTQVVENGEKELKEIFERSDRWHLEGLAARLASFIDEAYRELGGLFENVEERQIEAIKQGERRMIQETGEFPAYFTGEKHCLRCGNVPSLEFESGLCFDGCEACD